MWAIVKKKKKKKKKSSEILRAARDRVPTTFLLGCDGRVKGTANLKKHA